MKPVITIQEARKIMGEEARDLSDEQVEKLIDDLDFLAKAALHQAKEQRMKEDAASMANLIYDIYQEKKRKS